MARRPTSRRPIPENFMMPDDRAALARQIQADGGSTLNVTSNGQAVDPQWLARIRDTLENVPGVRTLVSSGNVLSLFFEPGAGAQVVDRVRTALAPLLTGAPEHVRQQLNWAVSHTRYAVGSGTATPPPAWLDQYHGELPPNIWDQPGVPPPPSVTAPGTPAPVPPGPQAGGDMGATPLAQILAQQEVPGAFNDPTSRFPTGTPAMPVDATGIPSGALPGGPVQGAAGATAEAAQGGPGWLPTPPPSNQLPTGFPSGVGQAVAAGASAGVGAASPWLRFNPNVRLDTSQVIDRRNQTPGRVPTATPGGMGRFSATPGTSWGFLPSGLTPGGFPTGIGNAASNVSGGTVAPPAAPAAPASPGPAAPGDPAAPTGPTQDQTSAFALIQQILTEFGIPELAQGAWDEIKKGRSQPEVLIWLRSQQAYKDRYVANERRRAKGLPALSEAEIRSYEETVRQMMRAAGLPPGFYDQPTDFATFLERDVSPSELQTRITDGFLDAASAPAEARAELQRLYGVGTAQLAAYFINPDAALPVIQRQWAASQLSGSGVRSGFGGVSSGEGEWMAGLEVSDQQAEAGFGQLVSDRELFTPLTGQQGTTVGRESQLRAAFGGDQQARSAIDRVARKRQAVFGGGGSIAAGRSGLTGLGGAET